MESNSDCRIVFPVSENSGETHVALNWLPYCKKTCQLKYSVLIGETLRSSEWPDIFQRHYCKFNNLCHVTGLDEAKVIIEKDGIAPTETVISSWREWGRKSHCAKTVIFIPNTKDQVSLSLQEGNIHEKVKFLIDITGDGGIVDHQFGPQVEDPYDSESDIYYWNHYFLGIRDHDDVSVCRILVTRKVFHHLLPYEPTELGGPWYWHVTENSHYYLQSILGYDNKRRNVSIEFVRESDVVKFSKPGKDWSVIADVAFTSEDLPLCPNCPTSSHPHKQSENMKCPLHKQVTMVKTELLLLSWFHSRKGNTITDVPGLRLSRLRELIQDILLEEHGDFRDQMVQSSNTKIKIRGRTVNDCVETDRGLLKTCISLFAKSETFDELDYILFRCPNAVEKLVKWNSV